MIRVCRGIDAIPHGSDDAFLIDRVDAIPAGFETYLRAEGSDGDSIANCWPIPEDLMYLSNGDIVELDPPSGNIWVMYRKSSPHNSMLLTERCNSKCVMCSQPPKKHDDSYLVDAYLQAIPLMSRETELLGITGGEPTLLGDSLFRIFESCKAHLPDTGMHMLSNGRLFSYLSLCRELSEIQHPDYMVAIPLYSDIAHLHDFVVQSPGAFDQTVRGIMNLARYGVSTEVRMVIHRYTAGRLPQFARFIARNLPFVEHVALMGLEMMGFVKMNLDALWIDPVDYQRQLREAVEVLSQHRIDVSIYNHQLCTLDKAVWPVARQSISDWKNEYVPDCEGCHAQDLCGGFFSSSTLRHSDHIRPFAGTELSCPVPQTSNDAPHFRKGIRV